MRMTAQIMAVAAMALSCGGGSGPGPGACHANTECADGLVCVLPTGGGGGTCQAVPLKITLTAPAPDARIGAAGIAVTAHATLGAVGGVPPETLTIVVNGVDAGTLAKTGATGVEVVYEGRYAPAAGASFSGLFFVAASTSAGRVPSNGVAVSVDAKPPALALLGGGVKCSSGGAVAAVCPRDGLVDVTVTAQDDNPAVLDVALDLDGFAAAVPFAPAPQGFIATVALGKYPFPTRSFSRQVQLRVRARDSFGNESTLDLDPLPVTRLRWTADLRDPPLSPLQVTGAAIAANGDVIVGASDGKLHTIASDGTQRAATPVGAAAIRSAPSVGATTVWVGSEDGRLYGRPAAGNVFSCPVGAATPGPMFTPAVLTTTERAYSGGSAASVVAASPGPSCLSSPGLGELPAAAPVVLGGKVFVATATTATIVRLTDTVASDGFSLKPSDNCSSVTAPIAAVGGKVILACDIAQGRSEVHLIDPAAVSSTLIATLPSRPAESPVAMANGDLVVGTNDGKVHRLTPPAGGTGTWTEAWTPPTFTSPVTGTLVAEPDAAGVTVYAVSATGALDAIAEDGTVQWSIPEASALGAFPLTFPTIAPAPADPNTLPTLYVGSGEGKLYAVVVDKGLDPGSPWPKSHHDIRNTGNADALLP